MATGGSALVVLSVVALTIILMLAIGGFLLKVALSVAAKVETTLGHAMVTVLYFSILGAVLGWLSAMILIPAMGGPDADGNPPIGVTMINALLSLAVTSAVIKSRYEISWGIGVLTALVMWILQIILFFGIGLVVAAVLGASMVAAG